MLRPTSTGLSFTGAEVCERSDAAGGDPWTWLVPVYPWRRAACSAARTRRRVDEPDPRARRHRAGRVLSRNREPAKRSLLSETGLRRCRRRRRSRRERRPFLDFFPHPKKISRNPCCPNLTSRTRPSLGVGRTTSDCAFPKRHFCPAPTLIARFIESPQRAASSTC